MDDACQSIDRLSVEQQIQADQVRLALLPSLVVEAGVARGDGLQGVVEVAPELRQRQSVSAGPRISAVCMQVLTPNLWLQEPHAGSHRGILRAQKGSLQRGCTF